MRRTLPVLIALALAVLLWLGLPDAWEEPSPAPIPAPGAAQDPDVEEFLSTDRNLPEDPLPGSGGIDGIAHRSGKPVAARIEIRRLGGDWNESLLAAESPLVRSTTSGADGRFAVRGLALGTYEVAAVTDDGARGALHARLRPGYEHLTVAIGIPANGLVLRGRAVWSDGRPFRGRIGATGFEDRVMEGGEWGPAVHVARSVETARDGTFILTGLPPAVFLPTALVPGRVRFVGSLVRIPTESEVLFVVDQGWRPISGRVVADDTGQPVPGAVVTRYEWRAPVRTLVFRTETDAKGRFLTWTSFDHSTVYVSKGGFPRASAWLKEGEDEIVVRLKRFGRVRGRVVTYEGKDAVAGAVVHAAGGGSAITDSDGRYVLDQVPPGDRLVYVKGGGWVSTLLVSGGERPLEPLVITVTSGAEIEQDLTAVPAAPATVTVLDEEGRPVPDALVTLSWTPRSRLCANVRSSERPLLARTGPDGSCDFECLIPGVWFGPRASVAGRPSVWGTKFRASTDQPAESVIRLKPCIFRTVRFVFADTKEPVVGAVVRWDDTWITDDAGLVEIGPVPEGEYKVRITHPDVAWTREKIALPETAEPVTIEVARGACLGGRATWEDGRPAADAFALLHPENGRDPLGVPVSSDGTFRFQRLPPTEMHQLQAWIRRGARNLLSERIPARAGAFDHNLELRDKAPGVQREDKLDDQVDSGFVLRVLGPDGASVASGSAVLWIRQEKWIFHRRATVRKGTCSVPIDEGWEAIFAELFSCRTGAVQFGARIEPVENRTGTATVRLEAGREIRGRVVDQNGNPVIGAEVKAFYPHVVFQGRTEFAHGSTRTGEDGTYRLGGLGDLTYDVKVLPPKPFSPCSQSVRAGRTDVVAVVETAAVPVITVLDHAGRPVDKASLRIEPEGGGQPVMNVYRSVTGADGKLRVEGLEPRKHYRLSFTPAENRSDLFPKTIEPWAPLDTEIRLDRAYEIEGVVRKETGDPPSGQVAVYLRKKGEGDWSWQWTRDGEFSFSLLTAGEYELKVSRAHGRADDSTLPITTVQAGQQNIVLTLSGPR